MLVYYLLTLIMDQPQDAKILPGMAGKSWAEDELPATLGGMKMEIPETALFSPDTSQKTYVWVIDTNTKTVNRREIEVGIASRFGVVVKEGLKPGEWVATAGVHYLREGQEVRLLEDAAKEVSQ